VSNVHAVVCHCINQPVLLSIRLRVQIKRRLACLPAEAALDAGEQQLMKNMMARVERLAQAAEEVRLALGVGRRVRHVGRHAWGGGRGTGGTQAGRQEAAHWCTASGAPAQRMTVPSASTLPLLAG
jgi:hypothetical protein